MRAALLAIACAVAAAKPSKTSMKVRLRYFDARGAAELSRVMLKYASVDFEDERWAIEEPGMKAPGFHAARGEGGLAANLGRAPVLDAGENTIGQSRAIERYVARTYGLMGGGDEVGAARVDAFAENCRDVASAKRDKGFHAFSAKDDAGKQAARAEWYAEDLPAWLAKLEEACDGAVEGFSVGETRSYGDFALWSLLADAVRGDADDAAATAVALAMTPKLAAVVCAVEGDARVATWVADRPETRF